MTGEAPFNYHYLDLVKTGCYNKALHVDEP